MSKRVAVLLPRLSRYGGAEGFAWRLAEAMAARGHETTFICARRETEPPPGVKVLALGRPPLRAAKVVWFAWSAARAVESGGFDTAISLGKSVRHDICRVSGGPLKKFWQLSKRAWPEGLPRSLKMARRRLSPANAAILAIEKKQFVPGANLVAVSHKVRDWLCECYPDLDPARIPVVYNQPDLSRYSPPDEAQRRAARSGFGLAEAHVCLTLAGTNFALKGLAPLIRALAGMPPNFRLMVAGGRRPGRFAKLARELGVAERVRFLGRVTEMAALYHATDIFTLPSFYDTCSNAVLEALASGCRVISSADNGSSFFLPKRWVVADPGDEKAMCRIILAAAREAPPPPFAWPDNVSCGLDPYIKIIES